MQLTPQTVNTATEVGYLLISAAEKLAALSPTEQEDLSEMTQGNLPACLAMALRGAAKVSPAVQSRISNHAPVKLPF